MSNDKVLFEVKRVSTLSDKSLLVFGKFTGKKNFTIKAGVLLNNCETIGASLSSLLDENDNQRWDCREFSLRNYQDKSKFSVGDVVELTE